MLGQRFVDELLRERVEHRFDLQLLRDMPLESNQFVGVVEEILHRGSNRERTNERARCSVFARLLAIGRWATSAAIYDVRFLYRTLFPAIHTSSREKIEFFSFFFVFTHAFNHDAELQRCSVRNDALSCVYGLEFLSTGETNTDPTMIPRAGVVSIFVL